MTRLEYRRSLQVTEMRGVAMEGDHRWFGIYRPRLIGNLIRPRCGAQHTRLACRARALELN